MRISEEAQWTIVAVGSAAAAAWLTRAALKAGWRSVRGEEPPENPVHSDVTWTDALLWTGGTAAAAAVARLLARRGTAGMWERIRGETPPA